MAELVYCLCGLTSILCAALLLRTYFRKPVSLLLWVSLCFIGLAISNILLVIDLIFLPHVDLSLLRLILNVITVGVLTFGLIREAP